MKNSKPNSLNLLDYQKIGRDLLYFSLVPITFYIGQVLTTISLSGHVLNLADFVPNNATLIAIVAWVGNQALNAIRKFMQ